MAVTVSLPEGSGAPGCEATDECYVPYEVTVAQGATVTWSNDDSAAHTVTSGTPAEGHDGLFDSSLFMAAATYEFTFDETGSAVGATMKYIAPITDFSFDFQDLELVRTK